MALGRRGFKVTTSPPVLLDTSAWIAYFASAGHETLKSEVRDALGEERIHTCVVVKAELLVGARDRNAFTKLATLLGALPEAPIDVNSWRSAAELGFSLRRKGRSIPLADLLVAEVCRAQSLQLWHLDRHYETICKRIRVQARSFLDTRER